MCVAPCTAFIPSVSQRTCSVVHRTQALPVCQLGARSWKHKGEGDPAPASGTPGSAEGGVTYELMGHFGVSVVRVARGANLPLALLEARRGPPVCGLWEYSLGASRTFTVPGVPRRFSAARAPFWAPWNRCINCVGESVRPTGLGASALAPTCVVFPSYPPLCLGFPLCTTRCQDLLREDRQ